MIKLVDSTLIENRRGEAGVSIVVLVPPISGPSLLFRLVITELRHFLEKLIYSLQRILQNFAFLFYFFDDSPTTCFTECTHVCTYIRFAFGEEGMFQENQKAVGKKNINPRSERVFVLGASLITTIACESPSCNVARRSFFFTAADHLFRGGLNRSM